MPYIIYSCATCKTTIFRHEDPPHLTEIHAGHNYCQSCKDAIDQAQQPDKSIYTCIACRDQGSTNDPRWRHHDELGGMCCPSCLGAEAAGYVLMDYYKIDHAHEQNFIDAYESHLQLLADENDAAETDPYHGRI